MKKEYDFSKGERGKFHTPNANLNYPVFLNEDNYQFFNKLAKDKNTDLSFFVNKILAEDKKIVELIK